MIKIAVLVLFWIAVGLIQKFNWDLGLYKALTLFAVLASVPFVTGMAQRRRFIGDHSRARLLIAATLALLCLQSAYAIKELRHPSLIDAATTTLAAGELLRAGDNPYAAAIDTSASEATQDPTFAGYKYLPLTIAAYLPLGTAYGERGIVITNLLLQLSVAWLIFRLARDMATRSAGWLAMLFYLSLPLVPFQLFAKGAIDLVPVLPLLAAFVLIERNALIAGLCVGLSLSAKLLPGALLLPCCLPATPRGRLYYAAGIVLGLMPVLPFALASPQELFNNIVLFNMVRPTDSTSWLFATPAIFSTIAHSAVALFYVAVAVYIWARPPTLALRCGLAALLVLALLLASPAVHHNYHLWWLPLVSALLAVALAPAGAVRPPIDA